MLWEAFSIRNPEIALCYVKKIIWNLVACGFALAISRGLDFFELSVPGVLGKETLGIYMLQTFVYENLVNVLSIPDVLPQWIRYVSVFMIAALVTALCYFCVKMIRRNKVLSMVLLGTFNKKMILDKEKLWMDNFLASKQASKQTSKQANKQTSKQANKQTSKQANKQAREKWVDVLKGLLIFSVVLGHSISSMGASDFVSKSVLTVIYTVHMPLFFILSGYTYISKNITFKDFLCAKLKRIMLPCLCFAIVDTIIDIVFGAYSFEILIDDFKVNWYHILLMTTKSRYSSLWFLPTITMALLMVFIIEKKIKKTKNRILVSIILALISQIWYLAKIESVFGLREALLAQLLVIIGFYLKDFIKGTDDKGTTSMIFATCYLLWLYGTAEWIHFGNTTVNYWNSDVAPITWTLPLSLLGAMACISLVKLWNRKNGVFYDRVFNYLGINSLYIYGLHYSFLRVIPKYLADSIDLRIRIVINTILVIVVTVIVLEIYRLIKRTVSNKIGITNLK